MKITLCGSLKYEKEYKNLNELLTLAGHVVYTVACYPSDHNNDKDWYTSDQKFMLDVMHLAKIDNSDAIVVIDVNDYIGESTRREILYAEYAKKYVWYYSEFYTVEGLLKKIQCNHI
jgi:hypothetical protein